MIAGMSGTVPPAELPPELAAAARRHARRLGRKFQRLFLANPKLKERYGAAFGRICRRGRLVT